MRKNALRWIALAAALLLTGLLAGCGGGIAYEEAPPALIQDNESQEWIEDSQEAEGENGEEPGDSQQGEETPAPPEEPPEENPPQEGNQPGEPEGNPGSAETLDEEGWYNSKEEVALYIHLYGRRPGNYVTKREAQDAGWSGGSVEQYTGEGTAIGGSRFGNYEGNLPQAQGRTYTECDIDTVGSSSRGAKRIVFSNDGLVYYTDDHYETFELLYGEP